MSEITGNISINIANGDFRDQISTGFQVTQATAGGGNPGTLDITTSDTAIVFTGLTSPSVVELLNLDSSNFVKWGPESGGAMVECGRLYPGPNSMPAAYQLAPGATLRMQADTGTCKVRIKAYEL